MKALFDAFDAAVSDAVMAIAALVFLVLLAIWELRARRTS